MSGMASFRAAEAITELKKISELVERILDRNEMDAISQYQKVSVGASYVDQILEAVMSPRQELFPILKATRVKIYFDDLHGIYLLRREKVWADEDLEAMQRALTVLSSQGFIDLIKGIPSIPKERIVECWMDLTRLIRHGGNIEWFIDLLEDFKQEVVFAFDAQQRETDATKKQMSEMVQKLAATVLDSLYVPDVDQFLRQEQHYTGHNYAEERESDDEEEASEATMEDLRL